MPREQAPLAGLAEFRDDPDAQVADLWISVAPPLLKDATGPLLLFIPSAADDRCQPKLAIRLELRRQAKWTFPP